MGIHEGQCFWNVSFCQVHRHIGEELRLELRTFISISLRWEVLVNCEKFASMVCVAVLNRLKIRLNNMDSESFVFFKHGNQNRQEKIYCGPYTSRKSWHWVLRSYLVLLISFSPMIFSLLFSFLLFTSKGFFFLMDFYLLFTDRFSFWFLGSF